MKQTFYYCMAIACGIMIGWFIEPDHQPHTYQPLSEQTVKTIDSLQLKLTDCQAKLNHITDSLSQADGE